MSVVGEFFERKDRPAYVRFERVAVDDPQATATQGHYVARDLDMVLITPPYSRDVFKIEAPQWIANMKQDVLNDRLPKAWMEQYLDAYARWQNGQEIPLVGTPIKGWGVLSPAQQKTLIELTILTVEDLAGITDEGIHRVGMGAIDLRTKATAWLSQLDNKGPLTLENAQLKQDKDLLNGEIETLKHQVAVLTARVEAAALVSLGSVVSVPPPLLAPINMIAAADILDDQEPIKRGPGRPPKEK